MTVVSPDMLTIVFEGLDGAGKTTLFKAFEKLTEHYYACFDRWPPISCYVYDRFFQRYQGEEARIEWFKSVTLEMFKWFGLRIIHVDTAPEVCYSRLRGEESYSLEDFEQQRRYYADIVDFYEKRGVPILRVDGTRYPLSLALAVSNWLKGEIRE